MENFVVSARKYRPATFDTVVGQSHITTTLKNAIKNNHLAQSFLFCGPRGVGKTTNARILAKTINCMNITADTEACDTCESCKAFNENASFNIHELDAASNNSVEDIRSLVDQVRYPPQGNSKYKIYIIDEVHMLSNAAFNAFLKTLEEPPKYAIFILATTEKHKIIPTILSRCQIFDFNRIQVKDISDHLASIAVKEGIKAEPQALHLIAQKADGGLRDALSMFDLIVTFSSDNIVNYKTVIDNLHILDYDYYFKITEGLNKQDIASALVHYDEILRKGFDGHNFIVGLSEHLRNLMVCKDKVTLKLLEVSEDIKQKYEQQASAVSISFIMSALSIANACDINYKSSKNHRLHVELALMKIGYLNAAIDLSKQPLGNEEAKKKSDSVAEHEANSATTVSPSPENHTSTTPSPQPAHKAEVRNTFKLPDLKTLQQKATQPQAIETVVQVEETPTLKGAFTTEQLMSIWKDFTVQFKEKGMTSEYLIMDREINVAGEKITVRVDNLIQVDLLNSFKVELLEKLRKTLQNSLIHIDIEVKEETELKKIYTSKEKFQYLASKFPALEELKNRLGLDTDF